MSNRADQETFRSMADIYRRFLPDRWSEIVREKRPGPFACGKCEISIQWKRTWGGWQCLGCGHIVWDKDR